jgi:uncharacterized small protein (DUF1192 family)
VRPWELGLLTVDELTRMTAEIDRMNKEANKKH